MKLLFAISLIIFIEIGFKINAILFFELLQILVILSKPILPFTYSMSLLLSSIFNIFSKIFLDKIEVLSLETKLSLKLFFLGVKLALKLINFY